MLLSKCEVCDSKKSKIIPEMYLRQPQFTYSA